MKLQTKLILGFLLATLIPFSIGMIIVVRKVESNIIENSEKIVQAQTEAVSGRLSDFFDKWTGICNSLSRFDFIKEKDWTKLDPVFKSISRDNPEITDFFLTNPDGSYWYGPVTGNPYKNYMVTDDPTDPNSPLKSINTLTYQKELVIKNTKHEEKTVVTEAYTSVAQGMRMFAIGSTIMDNNRVQGVIGVGIEAKAISTMCQDILADFEKSFGRDAKLTILSNDTHVLFNYLWDEEANKYVDLAYNLTALQTIEDALPPFFMKVVSDMENANVTSMIFKDPSGVSRYAVLRNIPNSPYTIFLNVSVSKMTEGSASTIAILGIMGSLISAILIIVTVAMGRRISRSIVRTSNALKNISEGSGDLTVRMKEDSKDEIGSMSHYFNNFIESQNSMISSIKVESMQLETVARDLEKHVDNIRGDMKNISESVYDLNDKAQEQNVSTEQTASTAKDISENITKLTNQVNEQSNVVMNSSAAVEEMVQNIDSIADNLGKAAQRFETLKAASTEGKKSIKAVEELVTNVSEQSTKLLDTNRLINAIANQTNLLAMNAAIEAAHAGDAGRGFSVVAEEIRKLAEDAAKQSKTIADELKTIVANIATIVDATAKADVSFDNVAHQVGNAGDIVAEISNSLHEQTAGNKIVLQSLENIQNITEEVRDSSVEMGVSISSILKSISRLTEVSNEVRRDAETISVAVKTIDSSIEQVHDNSVKNTETVDTLNLMTGKFKL